MAQQTTCFRSDAGNDFPDEFSAWKDDLHHYILGVTKNEKIARDLADAMCADLKPRYGKPEFTGAHPPCEHPGIAAIISKLNLLHVETPPELPLHMLASEITNGEIAGVTRIGPTTHFETVAEPEFIEGVREPPPYSPGAAT